MRTFNFKSRQIGDEKYLTYTMGEECELDEDVLDYCEENTPKELLGIIYEEDDDYDYLTYDITDKVSLEDYISDDMNSEKVLFILRNIASSLISVKEQAIPLGYILLNRNFMYIKEDGYEINFICLPIENKGSVAAEFKSFVRQLLANMKYDVEEDLNYVGKLLTYINGDNFNLRGLIGLSEALMEEEGLSYEEAGAIDADGVEVVSASGVDEEVEKANVADFMNSLSDQDEVLPEIGDDEDDYEEDDEPINEEVPVIDDEPVSEDDSAIKENTTVEEVSSDEEVSGVEEDSDVEENSEVEPEEKPAAEKPEDPIKKITRPGLNIKLDYETTDSTKEEEVKPEDEVKSEPIPTLETPTAEDKKESDIDAIKTRIKQLVGEVPSAKVTPSPSKSLNTISDLDDFLGSKPPVIKKNVVKVNRAAIIQSAAEHESENTEKLIGDNVNVPVIEDTLDTSEKPKSKSILSKMTLETQKAPSVANVPKATPYLIRVNTQERIMLGKVVFKIGKASRGVDYTVDGNGAISRQHAVILQKDGVCYIKDNKSTNHTYVNGHKVEDGIEEILTHDSMIRLGDEEFMFKIR